MAKRYLYKFTSANGSTISYTFPTKAYEYDQTQGVISPRARAIGADYAVRLRSGSVIRDVGMERIRALYVGTETSQDTEADDARSKLYLGAYGKLWTKGADSSER